MLGDKGKETRKKAEAAQEDGKKLVEEAEKTPEAAEAKKTRPPAPPRPKVPELASSATLSAMTEEEKEFVNKLDLSSRIGSHLRFDKPGGKSDGSMGFSDSDQLTGEAYQNIYPTKIILKLVDLKGKLVLGSCSLSYPNPAKGLGHGKGWDKPGEEGKILEQDIADDPIVQLRIGFSKKKDDPNGVYSMEIRTKGGKHKGLGPTKSLPGLTWVDSDLPHGFRGLKGFYGYERDGVVERIGAIWGV